MKPEPDIKLDGFSLWVTGRQFPDSSDYWDGNWLNIRANMTVPNAKVSCDGPILMTSNFARFRDELTELKSKLSGNATLSGLEPELEIRMQMNNLGHIDCEIEITPDQLNQNHQFRIQLDQSYLSGLMEGCEAILDRFPVVGKP